MTTKKDKEQKTAKEEKKYFFFYHSASPFSQFHPCEFELDGVHFVCAEQAMMYAKAVLFEDDIAAKKILNASSPGKMKALGRTVRNFNDKTWKAHRYDIVYRNNRAKFRQNEYLLQTLLDTGGKVLVEASPSDRIWGIGLKEADAKRIDPERWPGQNLLGLILTVLREELRQSLVSTAKE